MKLFYRIVLLILAAAVLSWVLPWLYNLCTNDAGRAPFVGWSPVNDRFIVSITDDADRLEIFDFDPASGKPGRSWTREQRDSLLPEIYANQLSSKGLMPDSVKGKEMTMHNIRRNRWTFSSFPRNFNRSVPAVYPLMESMPARFELEDPKVVLTMDKGVEIIDIESNEIDLLKTRRFAEMFAEKGFCFPARAAAANVTTRKAYDNGYLVIDSKGNLFHLKMQVNRPSMAKIELADSIKPEHVYVVENPDKLLYGFVADTSGDFYALFREGYRLQKLPGLSFDPLADKLSILKGLFSWVVKKENRRGAQWIALDNTDLSLLGQYVFTPQVPLRDKVASYIFPFVTTFTSDYDCKVRPRIGALSLHALFLNLLLALIIFFVTPARHRQHAPWKAAATLLLGLYIFIPLISIKK